MLFLRNLINNAVNPNAICWGIIFLAAPFTFVYAYDFFIPVKILIFVFSAVLLTMLYFNRSQAILRYRALELLWVVQILYLVFEALWTTVVYGFAEIKYIHLIFQFLVYAIIYLSVSYLVGWAKFIDTFLNLMLLISIFSVIGVFLIYHGLASFSSFSRMGSGEQVSNYLLLFSFSSFPVDGGSLVRSSGFFDEPGGFAFIILISLILSKFRNYSIWHQWIFVLGGLTTLSPLFVITSIPLIIIKNPSFLPSKLIFNSRSLKLLIFQLATSLIAFNILLGIGSSDEIFSYVFLERFERISDKSDQSANLRDQKFQLAQKAFEESPFFGTGTFVYTNPFSKYRGQLCCNQMIPLASHGLFGAIAFYSTISLTLLNIILKMPFSGLFYALPIMTSLLARPSFYDGPLGYLLFVMLFIATSSLPVKLSLRLRSIV